MEILGSKSIEDIRCARRGAGPGCAGAALENSAAISNDPKLAAEPGHPVQVEGGKPRLSSPSVTVDACCHKARLSDGAKRADPARGSEDNAPEPVVERHVLALPSLTI